jgi:hypothetical protein
MRVLVVGTLPPAIDQVAEVLVGAGHEVGRCHEGADPPFPCAGLLEGSACPLEESPVDVIVTARNRAWPRPSPYEDGAVCALRQHVPLVVVAPPSPAQPFVPWATKTIGWADNLVAACEEAASQPLEPHGEIASAAMCEMLERAGRSTEGAGAEVWRQRGSLKVLLRIPDTDAAMESSITARVLTALRMFDTYARGINISMERNDTS